VPGAVTVELDDRIERRVDASSAEPVDEPRERLAPLYQLDPAVHLAVVGKRAREGVAVAVVHRRAVAGGELADLEPVGEGLKVDVRTLVHRHDRPSACS